MLKRKAEVNNNVFGLNELTLLIHVATIAELVQKLTKQIPCRQKLETTTV